jgi:hypothetical protein
VFCGFRPLGAYGLNHSPLARGSNVRFRPQAGVIEKSSNDEEYHRFAFANLDLLRPEPMAGAGKAESGVNHLSCTYASAGDLLDLYARLRDLGITPYWPIHHGMTLSFYYLDPDGNRIELQVDCFDNEGSIAFMKSDVFAQNPIGIDVDPEALLQRYRDGASNEELLARLVGPMANIPEAHGVT